MFKFEPCVGELEEPKTKMYLDAQRGRQKALFLCGREGTFFINFLQLIFDEL